MRPRHLPVALLLVLPTLGCGEEEPKPDDTGLVEPVDSDGDGYSVEDDCDDADPEVHPDATELCDAVDNDCDGTVDEPDAADAPSWYVDADGDGYGDPNTATAACEAPSGHIAAGGDCNDSSTLSYPGAPERCDAVQNDCDAAWSSDLGLAAFVAASDGSYTDMSDTLGAGSAGSVLAHRLDQDGELLLCEGSWYLSLELAADVDITGLGGRADVIVHGGDSDTPLWTNTDGIGSTITGLTLAHGSAMHFDDGWSTGHQVGGNAHCNAASTLRFDDVALTHGAAWFGGALWIGGCEVTLRDVEVADNHAWLYGGGIYAMDAELSIDGGAVERNLADDEAGGVYLDDTSFAISDTSFHGNEGDLGSALMLYHTSVGTVAGCTFTGNAGGRAAVQTYSEDVELAISNSTFSANDGLYGGLYLYTGTSVTVSDTVFEDHPVTAVGVYHTSGTHTFPVSFTRVAFDANQGSSNAGAMVLDHGDVTLDQCSFTDNIGTLAGAVYLGGATVLEVVDTDFSGNSPSDTTVGNPVDNTPQDWGTGASFHCEAGSCS